MIATKRNKIQLLRFLIKKINREINNPGSWSNGTCRYVEGFVGCWINDEITDWYESQRPSKTQYAYYYRWYLRKAEAEVPQKDLDEENDIRYHAAYWFKPDTDGNKKRIKFLKRLLRLVKTDKI